MIRPRLATIIALVIGLLVTVATLIQIGVDGMDGGRVFFLLIGLALTALSVYALRKLDRNPH
ncbi:hypothetical protein B7R22_11405 [Subtercola boreus]|uniref:Uncharacterized protein n=1 Tax=Subtercola boreus TaxID=120213 RepID=A0A3E0VVI6_9MICO|nr:hypothetical protein B7R22_11405 [Subtercola boreus]